MRLVYWLVGLVLFPCQLLALEFEGTWRQGHILQGKVEPGTQVRFLGREIRVLEDGSFLIGLDRDAPGSVTVTTLNADKTTEHTFDVESREYRIQRIDGVDKKYMAPSEEELQRIRRESRLVKQARKHNLNREDYKQPFVWPLTGIITGVYGSQRVFNGQPRRPHYGVDIAAPTGTLVRAPAAGEITLAHPEMFFAGGTVILDHGQGLSSSFLHLSKILVEQGQQVAIGDPIAEVGATGRVTGPHLDWRMNWFDQKVDPTTLVPSMDEAIKAKKLSKSTQ